MLESFWGGQLRGNGQLEISLNESSPVAFCPRTFSSRPLTASSEGFDDDDSVMPSVSAAKIDGQTRHEQRKTGELPCEPRSNKPATTGGTNFNSHLSLRWGPQAHSQGLFVRG